MVRLAIKQWSIDKQNPDSFSSFLTNTENSLKKRMGSEEDVISPLEGFLVAKEIKDDDPLREVFVGTISSKTRDVSKKGGEDEDNMLSLSLHKAIKILHEEDEEELDSSLIGTIPDKSNKIHSIEDPPTPFIFVFPYPKGPPVAGAEAIPIILNVCPHCREPNPQRKRICPNCGANLTPLP